MQPGQPEEAAPARAALPTEAVVAAEPSPAPEPPPAPEPAPAPKLETPLPAEPVPPSRLVEDDDDSIPEGWNVVEFTDDGVPSEPSS